jgi:outer membrane receptor protein involved in Fe transport
VSSLPLQWNNCPAPAPIGANAPGNYCNQALALNVPQGLNNDDNTGLAGQGRRLTTFGASLKMNLHALGQTWTWVMGFMSYHDLMTRDTDMTPVEQLTATFDERYSQFSQEFRVASATNGKLEYLAGAYFQYDTLGYSTQIPAPVLNVYTARIPAMKPLAAYLPLDAAPSFNQTERVYSAFASLSWHVTKALEVTASLRATQDNKRTSATLRYGQATSTYGGYKPIPPELEPLWSVVLGPPGSKSLSRSDAAVMPSAQIQYTFAPQIMGYAAFNRGFKAGGINGQNGLGSVSIPGYDPEYVNAYELGLKSKLFNNRLLLNLNFFRGDYTNLQVTTQLYHPDTNIYSAEVANAGAARSQGVELEAMWVANAHFRFGASATYLNSYYVSYPDAAPTTLAAFEKLPSSNLSGEPTNYAPRWSASLHGQYTQDLATQYVFKAELAPYLSSSYYTRGGDPFLKVPGYVRLDGRISVETRDGRWGADLIGKNITNATIIAMPGVYMEAKEEPINVAIQFRTKW